ncbi:MAG: hypothetical protein EHM23_33020 [Acidobacteria bacterium]|nr:MAG: hypothetical protein EHM23_33020 [Acidobacteriota bacterium]
MRFQVGLMFVTKYFPGLALLLGLLFNTAWAEVSKIDGPTEFTDAIHLPFEQLPGQMTEMVSSEAIPLVGDEYASLGLTFLTSGLSHPVAVSVPIVLVIGPSVRDVGIKNSSDSGTSAGKAFVLRFQYPVRRIGLTVGNGADQTVVTLKAFGVTAEYLGSVTRTGTLTPVSNGPAQPFPFIGLSSTVPIASVTLDYGNEPSDEEIHDLYLEYFTPRTFVTYVPQVADGFFGSASVRTILQIQNAFETSTPVRVDFFQNGEPFAINIDGQSQTRLTLDLAGLSCRRFDTGGAASPGAVGYARIESTLPVKAQALYQIRPGENAPFQESGFQSTPARLHQTIPVDLDRETGFDTAIALLNGSEKPLVVQMALIKPDGFPPDEPGIPDHVAFRTIPPATNAPMFVSELIPYLRSQQAFKGSLVVKSRGPLVVTGVRTVNGIAVSSVPAVGTDR